MTGEQRLMLALLIDAINVYQRGAMATAVHARRLYVDAEHWIMTHSRYTGILSFETACDALGIHAGVLRRRIVAWKHAIRHHHGERGSSRLRLRVTPQPRHSSHRRGRPSLRTTIAS
ncbi:MAG TPA: hypothetical protein VKS22_01505 [Candidatus Binataceae bacterium]|nr:hypothetical protein [Candidatus Binataceae bacterium]